MATLCSWAYFQNINNVNNNKTEEKMENNMIFVKLFAWQRGLACWNYRVTDIYILGITFFQS